MSEVASLGLKIESRELLDGTAQLERFAAAAQKVDTAADKMGKRTAQAGQGIAAGSKASERMIAHLERMEKSLHNVERFMTPMSAGMGRAATAMESMASASRHTASGLDQVGMSAAKANDNVRRVVQNATAASAVLDRINKSTGVTTVGVNVGRGDDIAAYGKQLDSLREKYNPLFAVGQQYRREVDAIREAQALGAITSDEAAMAIDRASAAASRQNIVLEKSTVTMDGLNGKVKLTANQMTNLGYQVNDIATMLAMGASPFQIISSQAGQVIQSLGDGPSGVSGSLKAIGSTIMGVVSAIGPMRLAFGAATVAAGAFWYMSGEDKAKKAETALKSYEGALRSLKGSFANAGEIAETFFTRASADSITISTAKAQASITQLKAALAASIDAIRDAPGILPETGTVGAFGAVGGSLLGTQFSKDRAAFQELYSELAQGKITADEFAEAVARIRLDPSTSEAGRKLADGIREATEEARLTEARIGALGEALDAAAVKSLRMGQAFRSSLGELRGFAPDTSTEAEKIAAAFDEASSSARSYGELVGAAAVANAAMAELARPALEALKETQDRLANLNLSPDQRTLAEIGQRFDAEIEGLKKVNGSETAIAAKRQERAAALSAATIDITRAEEARRAGYDLDLRAIGARTAAGKAEIEAERVRIDMTAQGYSASEASAEAEKARNLSLAQSSYEVTEGIRQRTQAGQSQVEQAQFELTLIGRSVGETAALRAEYQMLSAAKQDAIDRGTLVSPEEEATIRSQAAEIGRLTEATQRLNHERDLAFRVQQAGRTPDEQEIADELRSLGLEYDSFEGQREAANLRYVAGVEKAGEALNDVREAGKDAFLSIVDAIGSGENALDSIMGVLANFNRQLAEMGAKKLFDSLFGTSTGGTPASGGGLNFGNILGSLFGGSSGSASSGGASVTASGAGTLRNIPLPSSRPSNSIVEAFSGQMLGYAKKFNASVDDRLLKILNTAAGRFDMRVDAISGLRPGDKRFHGQGIATDVQIYGQGGQALGNYQDASTFRTYERFAQLSKQVQQELFPELEGMLRWGGYFSGSKGKYGAVDTMHFDLAGERVGMGGGSWEGGLTAAQRRIWPGAESVGMAGASKTEVRETLAASVKTGMTSFAQSQPGFGGRTVSGASAFYGPATGYSIGAANDPWSNSGMDLRTVTGGGVGGFFEGAGGQMLMAGVGSFAGGMESGSPIGGALSGALAGLSTGNPIAALVGAAAGSAGGTLGRRERKAA